MLSVHLQDGAVTVRKTARPRRPRGYARIRLLAAGICNTDLELQRGYYGFRGQPGHEFVGVVEESDLPGLVGRRVVGEINLACRRCPWCLRGLGRHCPARTVLGIVNQPGAFAEQFVLPDHNLHLVPDKVSDEQAVFAEPLAAAAEILDQVKIAQAEPVAVLGDGKLGLLIAMVLQAHGARVRLFGRHADKLVIAESAGVETVRRAKRLPAKAYRVVVEATGSAEGLMAAIGMTEPRGIVVMKSTIHGRVSVNTAPVIVDEITLMGSRCGRLEAALKLLSRGAVRLDAMVAARYSLENASQAFEQASAPGVLKVLLTTSHRT